MAKKGSRRAADIYTSTVTLLFTDIHDSTKTWEKNPAQMQAALARYDEILQAGIEDHASYDFRPIGDACCAALPPRGRPWKPPSTPNGPSLWKAGREHHDAGESGLAHGSDQGA